MCPNCSELCKSKWEKSKRFPAGDYEYVDMNVQGTRYIVEAFLVGDFETARPTDHYASLLEIFPRIFVWKVAELKQIVRLVSTAIKQSMKSREMPMPPWRRNAYMKTKWFGPYRRTTNSLPSKKASKLNEAFDAKSSVGFETLPIMP
ncbi:hypothetical protein L484_018300 [Morus notabilis]|uniref:Uncharacterized protein n=1 Tax=Morus notabilis TaxID=981085 RepID=W9SRS4_9ROSA|nr:uncharacterized protein LOC21401275 [Morus notabilis]EXC23169.1 hypothetical protein L484_018300 [Morus notabilis]